MKRIALTILVFFLLYSHSLGQTIRTLDPQSPQVSWMGMPGFTTTSTPAVGSGVTGYFTTDLAPVRGFQGSGRFYTTWTSANLPANKQGGTLAYANSLTSPSQGIIAFLDTGTAKARLEIITAFNAATGAATTTSLINTAVTFSSGAQLVLVVDQELMEAWLFYNNAIVGAAQDVSAYAWIKQNRRHAIFSTTAVTPGSVTYDYGGIGLGGELVVNGDFSSAVGWSVSGGWAIGASVATNSAGDNNNILRSVVYTANKVVRVSFSMTPTSGKLYADLGAGSYILNSGAGTKVLYFATGSHNQIRFYGGAYLGVLDNVSAKMVQ